MNYLKYIRTPKEWIKLILVWSSVSAVFGFLFYREIAGAAAVFPFIFVYERFERKKLIEDRKRKLAAQFVEAVKVMTGGLKAGNSLEKTVTKARERLLDIYSEDELIMKELSLMETGLKMNISVEVLFSDFGKRSGVEDIREFAEVCAISKRAGGNLVKVMEHTSDFIVEKAEIERDIQTVISGKKLEGRCMAFVLPGLLAYMNFTMGDMMSSLYHNFTGRLIMSGALAGYLICLLWFEKLTDIKV